MKRLSHFSRNSYRSVIALSLCFVVSCGKNNQFTVQSQSAEVTDKNISPTNPYTITTPSKQTTEIGFLNIKSSDLKLDTLKNTYTLSGTYELVDKKNNPITSQPFTLVGSNSSKWPLALFPQADDRSADSQLRSRMTCLDYADDKTCSSLIVDIFLKRGKNTYAAQLQIDFKAADSQTAEQSKNHNLDVDAAPHTNAQEQGRAPHVQQAGSENTSSDNQNTVTDDAEEDHEDTTDQNGLYVGTLYQDTQSLFADYKNVVADAAVQDSQPASNKNPQTAQQAVKQVDKPATNDVPKTQENKNPTQEQNTLPREKPALPEAASNTTPEPVARPDFSSVISANAGSSTTEVLPPLRPAPLKDDTSTDPIVKNHPVDQVIGLAFNGRLENASSLLDEVQKNKNLPIHLLHPDRQRFYGSFELVSDVVNMAKYLGKISPDNKLTIGDLSQKNGGKLIGSKHKSHRNGLDADISYPRTDTSTPDFVNLVKSDGSVDSTMRIPEVFRIFEYAHTTLGAVDRIFVDRHIKAALCDYSKKQGLLDDNDNGRAAEVLRRLRHEDGHSNHFHMRIRCSLDQPRCRMMSQPEPGSGC